MAVESDRPINSPFEFGISSVPLNDDFKDRQVIEGTGVNYLGHQVGSSLESGEPRSVLLGGSVWYEWHAPTNGVFGVGLNGSSFVVPETMPVVVYTGNGLDSLVAVPVIQAGLGNGAYPCFEATVNRPYFIQVGRALGGFQSFPGLDGDEFRLSVAPTRTIHR